MHLPRGGESSSLSSDNHDGTCCGIDDSNRCQAAIERTAQEEASQQRDSTALDGNDSDLPTAASTVGSNDNDNNDSDPAPSATAANMDIDIERTPSVVVKQHHHNPDGECSSDDEEDDDLSDWDESSIIKQDDETYQDRDIVPVASASKR